MQRELSIRCPSLSEHTLYTLFLRRALLYVCVQRVDFHGWTWLCGTQSTHVLANHLWVVGEHLVFRSHHNCLHKRSRSAKIRGTSEEQMHRHYGHYLREDAQTAHVFSTPANCAWPIVPSKCVNKGELTGHRQSHRWSWCPTSDHLQIISSYFIIFYNSVAGKPYCGLLPIAWPLPRPPWCPRLSMPQSFLSPAAMGWTILVNAQMIGGALYAWPVFQPRVAYHLLPMDERDGGGSTV